MVLNAFDEVLFWDDLQPLLDCGKELSRKYFPHDRDSYFAEKAKFYKTIIPTKEELLRRFDNYAKNGGPVWIFGRSQSCDELSFEEFEKAIRYSKKERGKVRSEQAQITLDRDPKFWSAYAENVVWKSDAAVLELTVGAGLGTTCIMQKMGGENMYCGIDIDFVCAKQADALAKYLGINGLGLAASLWNIPFKDKTFDTVCCNTGLQECREVPTIIGEAARVLKPQGKAVLHCQNPENTQTTRNLDFKHYGIGADERAKLLRNVRLYESPEQVIELAAENGLALEDRIDDKSETSKGSILIFKK